MQVKYRKIEPFSNKSTPDLCVYEIFMIEPEPADINM